MLTLKVGGVPEHFNLPWHHCIEKGIFEQESINIEWIDFPGGTGAMCKALRNQEIDIAIILSEGIIYDIIQGNPSKLLSWYVTSPLIWGIHTSASNSLNTINDLEGKRYAISRFGSGSHLMAYVDALNRGWNINDDQWVVINNLDGARNSLQNNESEIFLWEKFTTKPYVDNGEFKRLGECPTPWPCFTVAAREDILSQHNLQVKKVIKLVQEEASRIKNDPQSIGTFSTRYQIEREDIAEWFSNTYWAESLMMEESTLDSIQKVLFKIGKIEKTLPSKRFIWN